MPIASLRGQWQRCGRGSPARRSPHHDGERRSSLRSRGQSTQQQRHCRRPVELRGHYPSSSNGRSPASRKSPAYGQEVARKDRPLINDFLSEDEFRDRLRAWFGNIARVLEPGGTYYLWGGYANLANYPPVLEACGLYYSQAIVWNKLHPVLTRKDFMGCFELAFYGWREGAGHKYYGPPNALDLWEVKKINPQNMVHLTEKPVELATRALQYSSQPGDAVFDPFVGSGFTLMAAQQTGRRAYLMELDPLYCDIIVARWEQFVGEKAERVKGCAS